MKSIAVVGAGISGLTCAYNLQKQGHRVTVYEARNFVGGRMSTRTKDRFPLDLGANHLANSYHRMIKLAAELDLAWVPMKFLAYRIIKDKLASSLFDATSGWTRWKLGMQSLIGMQKKTDFFDLCSAAKYDTDNAMHFIETKVNRAAVDYLIDPFVSTYQFHRSDEISLGVVYAMMRNFYKNKNDWHLQQIRGGMIALPQALADKLDVKLNAPVTEVRPTESGVSITTDTDTVEFDLAVLASTADRTEKMYGKHATEAQRTILENTKYAPTITVGFRVPQGTMQDITICWVPFVEGGKITGYTNEAMKGDEFVQNGETLLLTWFTEEFAKTIMDKSDEEIFALAAGELNKVCPFIENTAMLQPYDLERWSHAMPKFSHGHLTRVKTFLDNHQGENRVYLCGDYLNSPWTEGALQCGERVAARIQKKLI